MKRNLRKAGAMIMAAFLTIGMNACTQINKGIAEDVCSKLYAKYGCEFEAEMIGDRLNTTGATLYLHPSDCEDLVFTAQINRDTKEVTDNYPAEKVFYEIEQEIIRSLREKGIHAAPAVYVAGCDLSNETELTLTPKELVEKYSLDHVTAYMAVDESCADPEGMEQALNSTAQKLGIRILVIGFVLEHDGFAACETEIKRNPEMSSAQIKSYGLTSNFTILAGE